MTEWIASIILGFVQGLTEFLPISSSGHLALFQQFLPTSGDPLFFDLVLHLGSLVPVLWLYRGDIKSILEDCVSGDTPFLERQGVRMGIAVVLGSIPTAIIGLSFEKEISSLFHAPQALSLTFALTGVVLFATKYSPLGKLEIGNCPVYIPILIGVVQGLAITPGISRSGSTIAVALFLGVNRELAAKFSFLLSIPAITGAFLLKASKTTVVDSQIGIYILGASVAAVSGYLALRILVHLVKKGQFHHFSWYLWGVSLFALGTAYLT